LTFAFLAVVFFLLLTTSCFCNVHRSPASSVNQPERQWQGPPLTSFFSICWLPNSVHVPDGPARCILIIVPLCVVVICLPCADIDACIAFNCTGSEGSFVCTELSAGENFLNNTEGRTCTCTGTGKFYANDTVGCIGKSVQCSWRLNM
jgi:hypothetical protein